MPNENSDDIRLKSENSRLKYENAQMFEEIAKLRGEVETAKLCFDKIAKLKCLNEELNEEMKNLKTLNINLRDQLEEMYNLNKELNEENEKMKLSNECTTNTSKSGELQNVKDLLNIERNKNKTLSDEVESFKELLDGRLSSEEFTKKLPKVLLEGSDTFCVMKRDNDEVKKIIDNKYFSACTGLVHTKPWNLGLSGGIFGYLGGNLGLSGEFSKNLI